MIHHVVVVPQAVDHAKEIISGLDVQQEGVVVEEMTVGGNSKVRSWNQGCILLVFL